MSTIIVPDIETPEVDPIETAAGPGPGEVYTETVVWSAPEQFVQDAPYQLVIVTLDRGGRLTGRVTGERVLIGDRVNFAGFRSEIPFFQKSVA